jgi:glucokinase
MNGPECACGKKGCLEVYVGGRSMLERFKNDGGVAETVEDIFKQANLGESLAEKHIATWTTALATGVGNIVNIFNPQEVVLAGGLSRGFEQVRDHFTKILITQAFKESLDWCKVRCSRLNDNAGILGAAQWAQDQL